MKKKISSFIRSKPRLIVGLFFALLFVSYAKIFAIGSPYAPGATADPACFPGETNCRVSVSAIPTQTGNANKYLTTNGTTTAWSTNTVVLGGNFTTSGANPITFTTTGTTTLTLPTSGTLASNSSISAALSGTTSYVPKFTGSNAIGNSVIYDDGAHIGIGMANPAFLFDVNGPARFSGNLTVGGNIALSLVGTTVDGTGTSVGIYTSIKLGSDGFARISYYDTTNLDLKFVQCTSTDCSTKNTTTLDSTGNVGTYTSLAIASDGFARISYYDTTNLDLKFIQCTNADCSTRNTTSVDTAGSVGLYTSVAIASDGFARISYYDSGNLDLKFVQCTNADCSTKNVTSVDTTGSVGQYTSLALGSDGFARISYYDVTNSALKYAQCTNAACSTSAITTLDSGDTVGLYTSLALGSDGSLRISYNDSTNTDLKFFTQSGTLINAFGLNPDFGTAATPFRNVYVSSLYAKVAFVGNFDLAETYPTKDQTLSPGDIVMADRDNPLFISKADKEGTAVPVIMGIVSTSPGFLLGGSDDSFFPSEKKVPLALSGRVPVKVNMEGGAIAIGDPLSLSSVPGVGKKASKDDFIIGTALAPFDSESQGTVEAFVSMKSSTLYGVPAQKNITNLNGDPFTFNPLTVTPSATILEKFSLLTPTLYVLSSELDIDTKHVGFSPDEMSQLFTDSVSMGSINYTSVIPYTIQAIKDMNIQVAGIPTLSDTTLYSKISDFLRGIAEQGMAVADLLKTKKIETQETQTDTLCIGDGDNKLCINQSEFQTILNGQAAQSGGAGDNQNPPNEDDILNPAPPSDPVPDEAPPDEPPAETPTP